MADLDYTQQLQGLGGQVASGIAGAYDPTLLAAAQQGVSGGPLMLPETTITAPPGAVLTPQPAAAPVAPDQYDPAAIDAARQAVMGLRSQPQRPSSPLGQAQYDIGEALGDRQTANEGAANAQAEGAQARSSILGQQGKDMRQIEQQGGDQAAAHQAARAELMGQYKQLNDEASKMQVLDRRTRSQKVGAAIAVLVGGIGDAFSALGSGHTNFASAAKQTIDQEVERDLQEQREALADKRATAAGKLTELGIAREFFGDDQKALDFARASRKEAYANELEQQATTTQGFVFKQQGLAAAAALRQEAAQTKWDLYKEQEQLKTARISATKPSGVTMVSPELLYRIDRDRQEDSRRPEVIAQTKGAQLSQDLRVAEPDKAKLFAKKADDMQKGVDTTRDALATIDQILALRDENPNARAIPWTEANDTLNSLGESLNIHLKTLYELGVLNGPDMGILQRSIGSATGIRGGNDAKMRTVRGQLARKVNASLRARGFEAPLEEPNAPGATQQQATQAGMEGGGSSPAASRPLNEFEQSLGAK